MSLYVEDGSARVHFIFLLQLTVYSSFYTAVQQLCDLKALSEVSFCRRLNHLYTHLLYHYSETLFQTFQVSVACTL